MGRRGHQPRVYKSLLFPRHFPRVSHTLSPVPFVPDIVTSFYPLSPSRYFAFISVAGEATDRTCQNSIFQLRGSKSQVEKEGAFPSFHHISRIFLWFIRPSIYYNPPTDNTFTISSFSQTSFELYTLLLVSYIISIISINVS
jgi:hypothetical protein